MLHVGISTILVHDKYRKTKLNQVYGEIFHAITRLINFRNGYSGPHQLAFKVMNLIFNSEPYWTRDLLSKRQSVSSNNLAKSRRLSFKAFISMWNLIGGSAQTPVKFQNERKSINLNLTALRFCFDASVRLVKQVPGCLLLHLLIPPGQNGCHIADDVFRCIFVNEIFLFWL